MEILLVIWVLSGALAWYGQARYFGYIEVSDIVLLPLCLIVGLIALLIVSAFIGCDVKIYTFKRKGK